MGNDSVVSGSRTIPFLHLPAALPDAGLWLDVALWEQSDSREKYEPALHVCAGRCIPSADGASWAATDAVDRGPVYDVIVGQQ